MFPELEVTGLWWLPEKLEEKHYGRMKVDKRNKISIEMIGKSFSGEEYLNPFIIVGVDPDYTEYTLVNNFSRSFPRLPWGDAQAKEYSPSYLFKGIHFSDKKQIIFQKIKLELYGLEYWANNSMYLPLKSNSQKTLKMRYDYPKSHTIKISDSLSMTLGYRVEVKSNVGAEKLIIRQTPTIELSSSIPLSLDDLNNTIYSTALFFSFGMGFWSTPNKILLDDKIEFHFTPITSKKEESLENIKSHNMIFRYPDIKHIWDKLVQNWYSSLNLLGGTFDLLSVILNHGGSYVHHSFLDYIQAIESIHKHCHGKKKKYTLRERVKSVFLKTLAIADFLKKSQDKSEPFVKYVVEKRHQLSHGDNVGKKEDIFLMVYCQNVLKLMLVVALLRELGFTNQRLLKTVKNSECYQEASFGWKMFWGYYDDKNQKKLTTT